MIGKVFVALFAAMVGAVPLVDAVGPVKSLVSQRLTLVKPVLLLVKPMSSPVGPSASLVMLRTALV